MVTNLCLNLDETGVEKCDATDYRYDAFDRLIAADYTAPSGKPDTDFSTEYTYDILSRPTSIKRHGVVDVDGTDEVFGLLDNLTLTYDGATLGTVKSIITDETGRDYYGRTGFAKGTYMASAPVEYNAAGRLVKDTGRMLSLVRYNTMGLPVLYSMSTDMSGNPPRQERSYDATGMKRRQTDYGAVGRFQRRRTGAIWRRSPSTRTRLSG